MWTSRQEDKFSSFFRSSPVLKYPPEFSWLLHVPPVFSWLFHVHLPNVQFAPCAFRPRKQDATCSILNPWHSAEVFHSHFKFCFNNFIPTLGWLFHTWLMIIWIFVSFNSKFQNIYFLKWIKESQNLCKKFLTVFCKIKLHNDNSKVMINCNLRIMFWVFLA